MTHLAAKVVATARRQEGVYLLLQRFRTPEAWDVKDNLDRLYDACQMLVDRRVAAWLSGDLAPGIRLVRLDG
jgi:hypothetical protein